MTIIQKKPTGWLKAIFRFPILLYRLNLGFLMGSRFLKLTHTGRRSGLPREAVVEVVYHDEGSGSYFIAAAWRRRSDWYLNILKNPQVRVQVQNRKFEAKAGQISTIDAEPVYWKYAQKHPMAFRELTSIMLGEKREPDQETCRVLADTVPLMELVPMR